MLRYSVLHDEWFYAILIGLVINGLNYVHSCHNEAPRLRHGLARFANGYRAALQAQAG
jgi:hypothetical protein